MFENFTLDELTIIRDHKKKLRTEKGIVEISQEELDWLVTDWINYATCEYKNWSSKEMKIEDILTYSHAFNICGCMGAKDGAPWCHCTVSQHRTTYAYDIAVILKSRMSTIK